MNERIIEIILQLAAQIRCNIPLDKVDTRPLVAGGYTDVEIGAAYSWLADRVVFGRHSLDTSKGGFRILHETERGLFDRESYGYLILLSQIGLIDDVDFELVVARIQSMNLGGPIQLVELKHTVTTIVAETAGDPPGLPRLMLGADDTVH